MATKTSTSTNISITQKGDVYTVKEVKTKTTTSPGKEPVVETTETVKEYTGRDNLPESIRNQMDEKSNSDKPINMEATRGNFAEDILAEVNKYRKMHGVHPLEMSPTILKHCQDRAEKMAEKDEMLDEEKDCEYGESVSCMSSNNPDFFVKAEAVVSRWYSGSEGYDYKTEPTELVAGDFTQMVWKTSREFGVAAVKSKTNKIYIVASYNPRGNYVRMFIDNVLPPVSKSLLSIGKRAFLGVFDRKKTPPPSSSSSSPSTRGNDLNRDSVECHNAYRRRHGVPPLTYSEELASYAQEWANELARKEIFEHRSAGKYGENLYYMYNSDPGVVAKASDACDSWYSEIEYYTFGREPTSTKAGHFTQMIWRETQQVGMGYARSKTGRQYIVANYHPSGNYIGRFTANVPKPL